MLMPTTEWVAPTEFPDLRKADEIAIDLETRDPDLKSKGSGAISGNGEVVGIAVAVDGYKNYFPIAHGEGPNMPRDQVLRWFKDVCESPATKIFHNAMYDVCWIRNLGIKINGLIIDTMVAASLIDENRFSFTLNSLSWVYLSKGKNESLLTNAAKERGLDPKAEMWKMPASEVGAYAEEDAALTLELWHLFKRIIIEEDLENVFNLETDLFPCLVDMRHLGVRVDIERANQLKTELEVKEQNLLQRIKKETNLDIQLMAARSIVPLFDKLNLTYSKTPTGEPSFTKGFLNEHKNPVVNMIAEARKINKIRTTFIDSIIKHEHKGRIHADINQIRSDDGGTVTGRFSYSNPNLQQLPARNPETGPLIRSLFIPEQNHTWGCFDYSQQEPRLVVHYAATTDPIMYDDSVTQIVEKFKSDSVDFHQTVADMAGISRSNAKTINLGLFYGMGKAKLQAELGLSTKAEAENLFNQYHENVPFVRELMNRTSQHAQLSGSIGTLLGRRCRFNKWEPNTFGMHTPMSLEEAERTYGRGRIKRAFTYKSLNKLIQGSAADMK